MLRSSRSTRSASVWRGVAAVTCGVDAGLAAECMDFQAGIVGDGQAPGKAGIGGCFQDGVGEEGVSGLFDFVRHAGVVQ